jgi:hypothetical protein
VSPILLLLAFLLVFVAAAVHYLVTARPGAEGPIPTKIDRTDETRPVRASLESFVRSLSAAVSFGAILGLLIGGIGSRLAMRLLFLTSADSVKGLESDDGFVIGQFNLLDTLNLISFGTLIGVFGALIYLLIRRWLPKDRPLRLITTTALAAVMVGAAIVHPEGVDFTVLGPLWLAITLFLVIPGLFGALIARFVDRADQPDSWFQRRRLVVAASPLILLLFPLALIPLAVPIGITLLGRWTAVRNPRLIQLWESDQFQWAGRITIVGIVALASVALINDVRALA